MEIYGKPKGFGVDSPMQVLYQDNLGSEDPALRNMFGGWLPAINDSFLGVKDEVLSKHLKKALKRGAINLVDEEYGNDDLHRVLQFSVAIEKVDIPGAIKGGAPGLFVCAVVQHTHPLEDDDEGSPSYYSVDRGLLYPGASVRDPTTFVMEERAAALKKYGGVVDVWEGEEAFEVGRFVRRKEDIEWKFGLGELRDSTLWSVFHAWLTDEDARRQQEIENLKKTPSPQMADDDFATLFQKTMVEGS